MNSEQFASLNANSSQIEQEWLAQVENSAADLFLNENKPASNDSIAVVSVPDFSDPSSRSQQDKKVDAASTPRPIQVTSRFSDAVAKTRRPARKQVAEVVAQNVGKGHSQQIGDLPMPKPITADLREKPSDWLSSNTDNDKEERNKTKASSEIEIQQNDSIDNVDSKSISRLTDEILTRFPISSPTVIMFAGSEWNPHVDETCAQVAYQLASRNVGRILLVDSEFEQSRLTKASKTSSQPGVAEILNRKIDLGVCVADHDEANMDFLPIGEESIWHWTVAAEKIPPLTTDFKSKYQFACVSVGDALGRAAKLWANECDGAFLIVSMSNSSRTVAKSAVDRLHANGARLLGCIVSDAV